ncbi:MAG: hypothetical protein AAF327_02150 [Cyanobacteria bacterium P01_A01_bin.37]
MVTSVLRLPISQLAAIECVAIAKMRSIPIDRILAVAYILLSNADTAENQASEVIRP